MSIGYFAQHQLETLRLDDSPRSRVRLAPDKDRAGASATTSAASGFTATRYSTRWPLSGGEGTAGAGLITWQSPTCCSWMNRPTTWIWRCATRPDHGPCKGSRGHGGGLSRPSSLGAPPRMTSIWSTAAGSSPSTGIRRLLQVARRAGERGQCQAGRWHRLRQLGGGAQGSEAPLRPSSGKQPGRFCQKLEKLETSMEKPGQAGRGGRAARRSRHL